MFGIKKRRRLQMHSAGLLLLSQCMDIQLEYLKCTKERLEEEKKTEIANYYYIKGKYDNLSYWRNMVQEALDGVIY